MRVVDCLNLGRGVAGRTRLRKSCPERCAGSPCSCGHARLRRDTVGCSRAATRVPRFFRPFCVFVDFRVSRRRDLIFGDKVWDLRFSRCACTVKDQARRCSRSRDFLLFAVSNVALQRRTWDAPLGRNLGITLMTGRCWGSLRFSLSFSAFSFPLFRAAQQL